MESWDKPLNVVLFLSSTRPHGDLGPFPGCLGERVGKFVRTQLEEVGCQVTVIDPHEVKLPLLEWPYHWLKALKKPVPEVLEELVNTVSAADAYVFISAEYNYSIPPALANLIDHLPPLKYGGKQGLKPSLICCYSQGQFGGVRAATQLRAMAGEIGTIQCSNIFIVPEAHKALDAQGNDTGAPHKKTGKTPLEASFATCSKEFSIAARSLRVGRIMDKQSKI